MLSTQCKSREGRELILAEKRPVYITRLRQGIKGSLYYLKSNIFPPPQINVFVTQIFTKSRIFRLMYVIKSDIFPHIYDILDFMYQIHQITTSVRYVRINKKNLLHIKCA